MQIFKVHNRRGLTRITHFARIWLP